MRAYSQELRHQVLCAVDEGISRAEIIECFQVSRATIKRYLKQRRENGNLRLNALRAEADLSRGCELFRVQLKQRLQVRRRIDATMLDFRQQ